MAGSEGGFWVEEDPLRDWILKAYHETPAPTPGAEQATLLRVDLVAAVRELLSGPAGGPSAPGQYWFERDPDACGRRFLEALREATPELDRAVFEPVLDAIAEKGEALERGELAPNLSVWVASLSGPIALRTDVDETSVCALVAAALICASRLGPERVRAWLA